MNKELQNVQNTWHKLGEDDPYWAVLSDPSKRGNKWNKDEFFLNGKKGVDAVIKEIEIKNFRIKKKKALDFGCGIGRLTRTLSFHFDEVIGVDIAPSMIGHARKLNSDFANCEFVVNANDDLAFIDDNSIDLIYSSITLLHIPPTITLNYLKEFIRVIEPNGVCVCQIPYGKDWTLKGIAFKFMTPSLFSYFHRLRYKSEVGMEVHTIPYKKVKMSIENSGGRIDSIVEDKSAGEGWDCFKYFITKN